MADAEVPSIGIVLATDDIDQAIEQKEEAREQAEAELEQSEQREYAYLQEGLSVAEKLTALEGDLNALISDIEKGKEELAAREAEVEMKITEIEKKQAEVEAVSRSLYKSSRMSLVETLLSSEGMTDMLRQLGFRRFGIGHLLDQARGYHSELAGLTAEFNGLSGEIAALDVRLADLEGEVENLENQKQVYEQMVVAEAARQTSIQSEIENITAEQAALIQQKIAAAEGFISAGAYGSIEIDLPDPPFSPAYAVVSVGFPHRVGMSQYGAYGRALEGQTYDQILSAYYNANLTGDYVSPSQIRVVDCCKKWNLGHSRCEQYWSGTLDFEDEYMMSIGEMPASWGDGKGMEALKAQAVAARSYAISRSGNSSVAVSGTTTFQVCDLTRISNPDAANWHDAVRKTRGEVLISNGSVIAAYYCSTVGGYTRLTNDYWECNWFNCSGTNPSHIKRVADLAGDGVPYDGPGHGNSPIYYVPWYFNGYDFSGRYCNDGHPWLQKPEIIDLLNAAMLYSSDNGNLSHPDLGGWTYDQVVSRLGELGIEPIKDFNNISIYNSTEGYSAEIRVSTSEGIVKIDGKRFHSVYNLRVRGCLVAYSSLYDIIAR
jgi:peptidoglycan hydrolase CwlO-like protein